MLFKGKTKDKWLQLGVLSQKIRWRATPALLKIPVDVSLKQWELIYKCKDEGPGGTCFILVLRPISTCKNYRQFTVPTRYDEREHIDMSIFDQLLSDVKYK